MASLQRQWSIRRAKEVSCEYGCIGRHLVQDPSRRKHAGQSGAGMRPRADEKQIADVLARIVRPEPGALREGGLEAERRAAERAEAVPKIDRSRDALRHDLR